jgi:hypothetical protein
VSENLSDRASTQYDDWQGSVAGDEVDGHGLGRMLGIDDSDWMVVLVRISIHGGSQFVTAWGIDGDWSTYAAKAAAGRIEVTRLVHQVEHPHGHADTNPPRAPASPITVGHRTARLWIQAVRTSSAMAGGRSSGGRV